jgi:hypothetical protein
MRNDGRAEIQHYVPQLLLRMHVTDTAAAKGLEQVWCFDKSNDNVFSSNIKGILAGSRFYEVEIDGQIVSLEGSLTEIEDRAAPILARIVRARSLAEIIADERQAIAEFCAVQFVRTQASREQVRNIDKAFADGLEKKGFTPSQLSNFGKLSSEQIKAISLRTIIDAPADYGQYFLGKYWCLLESDADDPFHLGDHPVTVDNELPRELDVGIGLASPGASIYLPLCPTLCLHMIDPSLVFELFENGDRIDGTYKRARTELARRRRSDEELTALKLLKENRDAVNRGLGPFRTGQPVPYDHRCTMRVNSLQVLYAARWIISSRPDFSLPKMMIDDDEKFRKAPRFKVVS